MWKFIRILLFVFLVNVPKYNELDEKIYKTFIYLGAKRGQQIYSRFHQWLHNTRLFFAFQYQIFAKLFLLKKKKIKFYSQKLFKLNLRPLLLGSIDFVSCD